MNGSPSAHAWWSRLRHQGLLLSPVVMVERYPSAPDPITFSALGRLRDAHTRFATKAKAEADGADQAAILGFVDSVFENLLGHTGTRLAKQHNIPDKFTVAIRIGSRSDTIRPHRVVFADESGQTPALLVMADPSPQVGRGRGRTKYAHMLELLRGTGQRLGVLTNGQQFRLVYAGLDFESWCEWESDRWFDDGEGTEELCGLRQLLSPESLTPIKAGSSGLLDAVEESRKRQADLSSVLRENVRQAVELLLDEVSTANRTKADLFDPLQQHGADRPLTAAEAHEALMQATVRVVMRLVVCLFAESRQLLPVNDPIYAQAYGIRSLYEMLDEATRHEGGTHVLFNRQTAWPRLMAMFRLIYGGSAHGAFPLRAYGGVLFRPGDEASPDPVVRALHILEHCVQVGDATIYHVLRKLLRGPLPIIRGKSKVKTFVDGPVDYTDLRTEFIGLIYEGLLDYRVKRTDEQIGPQVFLNLGREPVLPLSRLQDMLANDRKGLKDLLTTLRKEKVTASAAAEEEAEEEAEDAQDESEAEANGGRESAGDIEPAVEAEGGADHVPRTGDYLDAAESAKRWAREAVVLAGLMRKQGKKESDSQYQQEVEAEANRLIKRVVATGEFYLVRAGNTRKGTGTFYTRPQLAVPVVHRTLESLCYSARRGSPDPSARRESPDPAETADRQVSPAAGRPTVVEVARSGDRPQPATVPAEYTVAAETPHDYRLSRAAVPRTPEEILSLKVCDPACGSASFLVAGLHYLTDALYKSLCHHCHLDDPANSKKITLPYGRPRTGKDGEELVPFPPDDPQRGHTFEDRIKALLRRHVVERCIYGVDINPLAVELARVSLWVETLDPELPFSFLDHKLKVGNSLVGCWLDRVDEYPILAWEREGGDGKNGPRTQRLEEFLKGEKVGNRRPGDGRIKQEMRQVIEGRFRQQTELFPQEHFTTGQVVARARAEYERLHDLPTIEPDEREQYYRSHIEGSQTLHTLKAAMDEWCAIWFWPTDAESLCHVPTPLKFHKPSAEKTAILARLAMDVKFFHWEMEFPDVFTPERTGFDAMIGNPPWDVIKPNSQEFFTEFDPLYRTYDKQAALRKQKELFQAVPAVAVQWDDYKGRFNALGNWARNVAEPFDMALMRGKEGEGFAKLWAKHRSEHVCYADIQHPFQLQGSADLNSYKMFTEVFWRLLRTDGRLGVILPTGIYSDLGTKDLREELLQRGRIDLLYAFQNEKKIFAAADHRFKQVALLAARGGCTASFYTRFRMGVGDSPNAHEIPDDILRRDGSAMRFTPDDVRRNSPKTLSLVELRGPRDLEIFRKISAHTVRIGDDAPGWKISFGTEFHMTNDSEHFPPLDKWKKAGFRVDAFGNWVGSKGETAVPFFEGRMIGQHDCSQKGWVSGKGRTAVWRAIPFDDKRIEPQYLVATETLASSAKGSRGSKVAIMDITSSTNTRSMIALATSSLPFGNSAPTLTVADGDLAKTLLLAAALNSFVFDFAARPRVSGVHFNWFILGECPIPCLPVDTTTSQTALATHTARLCFLHRRFAPEWLRLAHLYPHVFGFEPLLPINDRSSPNTRQWKHWWAVTDADRLRLRVEIDAICADLYGLDPDDVAWIVRDDPTDPKSFYRVDRQLPFRERLTGLAAAAFRALKDGKWSADSAAGLSNDQFFEMLGIPELTNAKAAVAKGLPGPLIEKRDGCHVWQPENFPADDPRHGWTWDDCWQDAVALLGSEDAVRSYVAGESASPAPAADDETFTLQAKPPKPKQARLF